MMQSAWRVHPGRLIWHPQSSRHAFCHWLWPCVHPTRNEVCSCAKCNYIVVQKQAEQADRGNDQLVARYFFHHFLGAEDIAWLAQFKDLHLSEDEAKALIVVREAGAINNGTYRELTKVDTLTASQSLRRLRDAGLLAQKGRGSATYYVPTERLLDSGLCSNPEALSSESEGLSTKLDGLSTKAGALSTTPEGVSA